MEQEKPQLDLVPIFLTKGEAMLFVEFQKRYAFIELLESIRAFDMHGGSIQIHFDSMGQIVSVEKREHFKV